LVPWGGGGGVNLLRELEEGFGRSWDENVTKVLDYLAPRGLAGLRIRIRAKTNQNNTNKENQNKNNTNDYEKKGKHNKNNK
jgi:hypothetical protein